MVEDWIGTFVANRQENDFCFPKCPPGIPLNYRNYFSPWFYDTSVSCTINKSKMVLLYFPVYLASLVWFSLEY